MISPAPAGVDPNNAICGECSGRLTMPWIHDIQGHALRCVNNPEHETYASKNLGKTKMLAGPNGQKVEVDVLTQKPVNAGADIVLIESESSALAVVKRQHGLAMWPDQKNMSEAQMAALAHVAYHYQMDIIMGEIMPFQGKPFITIKGRRRHDKREGHRMGITFRMPRPDELEYWLSVQAMAQGDVIQIAIGTEPDGTVTEAHGRVLMSEQPTTEAGKSNLPIAIRKIEMAQKRAESRVREMVFGAIGKPQGLNPAMSVLGEGEGVGVIEGTYREIPNEEPKSQTMPDFGECPEHGVAWKVEADKYTGNPRATHFIAQGTPWCNLSAVYKIIFAQLWTAKFGNPNEKDVNAWLKEKFGGKTWSKLAHLECLQAVDLMRVDTATGEVQGDSPGDEEQAAIDANVDAERTFSGIAAEDIKVGQMIALNTEGQVIVAQSDVGAVGVAAEDIEAGAMFTRNQAGYYVPDDPVPMPDEGNKEPAAAGDEPNF